MNLPDKPRKEVRFDNCDQYINSSDTDERMGYYVLPMGQINEDASLDYPSSTDSASPVSSDGYLNTPPIQELRPVYRKYQKPSSEEEEVYDKIVLHSSIILGTCNEWNTLFDPGKKCRSSLELPAIFQTGEFPRNLRLSHSLIPMKIPIYSQNPACIVHGEVYSALYSALQTHVSREYLLALTEDHHNKINIAYRNRCLELPKALRNDELAREPRTIDLLLGEKTFIGLKPSDEEDELEILFR
jgi:hypothetical protein